MKEKKIKIFLADDHHVFREGIRGLLESEFPIEVVGEAANGEEVLTKLTGLQLDLMLLDIHMPKMDGMELINLLSQQYPHIPVLVFSINDDEQYIRHMINSGVKGYILKNCKKDELIMAIKAVYSGDSYLGKDVLKKLVQDSGKSKIDERKNDSVPLTSREIEVLKLVAKGLTNHMIGKRLFISHRTVDTHRRNMMIKLDLHNAVELTNYAAENGLLEDI